MKASIFVGTSLDGFIARADGTLDFLHVPGAESNGYDEFIATVDAVVMGRNTFETVLAFQLESWPYRKPVIVLSTRELPAFPSGAQVERMEGAPGDIVRQLAGRGMTHIYVDGGVTIQRFLAAGQITHLTVTRVPVLIGSGIPLFGPLSRDITLNHVAARELPGGLEQSEYEVRRGPDYK